jgi:acyl dehydratase
VKVSLQGELVEVWDKGSAAVLGLQTTATDEAGKLFTSKASIFARGSGGFGGERGPSTKGVNAPPERAPDHVIEDETRLEQAAIYRLSGDRNPLHIDPEFAKMGGFDTPILHGLCTYGFVGRAILNTLCGRDPSKFTSLEARFTDVVYPGDTIITKLWVDGKEAIVTAETQKGNVVVSGAKATFR